MYFPVVTHHHVSLLQSKDKKLQNSEKHLTKRDSVEYKIPPTGKGIASPSSAGKESWGYGK